jgi:hypothetical protein
VDDLDQRCRERVVAKPRRHQLVDAVRGEPLELHRDRSRARDQRLHHAIERMIRILPQTLVIDVDPERRNNSISTVLPRSTRYEGGNCEAEHTEETA